eukprot:CAMPEP_0171315944 /NCGR_PEP_ID=MMETSP0816-20121228/68426_1 /TAXON_ID=420281 /ORGANISM="Proboscia inermis, Strain CCAP1064/1" /LENGTH=422 /DNA_ID=CAMNT_0011807187 /DNA_START=348 /DNA_END=1616 /DNA_ORIENTATION=-
MTWEGKMKTLLSPRHQMSSVDRRNSKLTEGSGEKKGGNHGKNCHSGPIFRKGWNDPTVVEKMRLMQQRIQDDIAQGWFREGMVVTNCETPESAHVVGGNGSSNGRLVSERRWVKEVLEPWSVKANAQLEEYQRWKKAQNTVAAKTEDTATNSVQPVCANGSSSSTGHARLPQAALTSGELLLPPISTIESTVPHLFQTVLDCLREASSNGTWPTTTPKRQLVMCSTNSEATSSTDNDGQQIATQNTTVSTSASLAQAHMRAKSNNVERTSAYAFAEGEGGASGSFSIGAMPGNQCVQPKGNLLFPCLLKSAFLLERALKPNREPSSMIAVNRNALFRPHVDVGAGAGQSTSLICGLGTYTGGELVVEGEKMDIRYKGVEFNGWKQRHWTMPFRGERFSLVWFTPKGCEGIHGLDLVPKEETT